MQPMTDLAIDENIPADPREERVRSVLVVGGGSSGWMAATLLATYMSRDAQVMLVESDAIGIIGVGEATIPPIKKFNNFIRLDEADFVRDTQGSFKLGIEFHHWARRGDRYIHQFGMTGREIDEAVKLHHWWLLGRLAREPDYPPWEDVFPARALAREDRFAFPNRNMRDPLGRFTYAYHFDAHLYSKHLRKVAESRGAQRIEGKITGVERDSGTGDVTAVVLESGQRIEADLFVDCSGFRSLLLGAEYHEPFEDWSHWIPNDRALAVPSASAPDGITPYTRATAHEVGWQWRIPLQSRIGNGHVFSSAFSSEGDAEQRLLGTLDTKPLDQPRLIKFATGRRRRAWVNNVVAVGLAYGFVEPLESTSIHLVQAALERLIENFPTRRIDPRLRNRFNRETESEWDRLRDFVIAHYHLTERDDSEFWRYTANMPIPDSLSEVLELWRERGVLDVPGSHLFQLGSWSAILIGQRCIPERVHGLADRIDPAQAARHIRQLVHDLRQVVKTVPKHSDFIAQHFAAPAIESVTA